MVVAWQTWQLSLPGCTSLKEKRSVVRSLKARLRNRFNVSVSETGRQDVHALAEISIALVATDRRFAESVLDKANHLVEEARGAVVMETRRELP